MCKVSKDLIDHEDKVIVNFIKSFYKLINLPMLILT